MVIRFFSIVFVSILLALSPAELCAQNCGDDVMLDNHVGPGMVAVPGFVAGEIGAASFELAPDQYPIQILRVGIGWGSQFGGSPMQLESAINVYEGQPPAVTPLASLGGPPMTDGVINEFDLEAQVGVIEVMSGPFTVGLQMANSSTLLGPSMVHDGAGCLFGRSYVFAIPGGWQDLCALGATGNWQIHVVYKRTDCGSTPISFVRGDCNVDGANNIADAIQLLGFLFPGTGPSVMLICLDSCDTNDDAQLNIADVIALLGSLFGMTVPLPAPGPACGPDPTMDALDCAEFSFCP